jgi:uncharacterized membrane protein
MRSDTQAVTIEAPASQVFAFVADPENLPRWAIGFAIDIRPAGDEWIVRTGSGAEVVVRYDVDDAKGTIDFHMHPGAGVDAIVYSRVVANGEGSDFVFTQQQSPGMPDAAFTAQTEALHHELVTLKALLEVSCPS